MIDVTDLGGASPSPIVPGPAPPPYVPPQPIRYLDENSAWKVKASTSPMTVILAIVAVASLAFAVWTAWHRAPTPTPPGPAPPSPASLPAKMAADLKAYRGPAWESAYRDIGDRIADGRIADTTALQAAVHGVALPLENDLAEQIKACSDADPKSATAGKITDPKTLGDIFRAIGAGGN